MTTWRLAAVARSASGGFCLQVLLLTLAVAGWWSQRNNTLFDNGRWSVGKDAGKFVFYSYAFLFQPLSGEVDLSQAMAFQEILYRRGENAHRRLTRLECEAWIEANGYLWLIARKVGPQMLGIRLSAHSAFPSGFYRYDQRGALATFSPLPDGWQPERGAWQRVTLTVTNACFQLAVNDRDLGAVADPGDPAGFLGFRGSGGTHSRVVVRRIRMTFTDPTHPGRQWVESEDFRPSVWTRKRLAAAFLFAASVLAVRRLRQRALSGLLPPMLRERYLQRDRVALTACLFLALVLPKDPNGTVVPAAILVAELVGAILLVAGCRRERARASESLDRPAWIYGLLVMAVCVYAFATLGEWTWRAQRASRPKLDGVDPRAYIVSPAATSPATAFSLGEPVAVTPGHPCFAEGRVYREQSIDLRFAIAPQCTMDLVFQQQSYRTRGDPDGEELPLQRRLLRLSTRPDVPMGLATAINNRPAPFLRLRGALRTDGENHLRVTVDRQGARIVLNGEETVFPGYALLDYGETGVMVFEDGVELRRFEIEPIVPLATRGGLWMGLGFAIPVLLAGLLWLVTRAWGVVAFPAVWRLATSALFPYMVYLIAGLIGGTQTLAFLDRERLSWLDLLLAASGVALLPLLVLPGRRGGFKPVIFNLVFLVTFAFVLLYVWDAVLPENHVLRLKFRDDAVVPGETIGDNRGGEGPWYSNNRTVGANTYVWKQRFSHERISGPKPAGTVRAFVVGGSQAWGSGASSSTETFTEQLERALVAKGLPVEIYGAGVNGAGTSKVLALYRGLLAHFEPDLIIADIGLNDSAALRMFRGEERQQSEARALMAEFQELVRLCRTNGTEVILVQEAMCSEAPLRPFPGYYEGLDTICAESGVPVVRPGPALREKEMDHMVWWDTAHLAPCGHRLLASLIEPVAEDVIRRRLRVGPPNVANGPAATP